MTLKEIAKEAGVSISTVSPCFKPAKHQSGQRSGTGAHLEHCSKTGYVPNPVARELRHALQPTPVMQSIYGLIACSPGRYGMTPFPALSPVLSRKHFKATLY